VPIDDDLTGGARDAGPTSQLPDAADSGKAPADGGDGAVGAVVREGCPGPPDDPDLVAWYPLDETEGTVAHDCSSSRIDLHPLTAAAPEWDVKAKIGGGANFDGVETCFTADDGRAFRFDKGEPFTIAAWVFVRDFYQADKTGRWIASHKASPYGWHFGSDDPDRIEIDFEFVEGVTQKKTQVSGVAKGFTWLHVLSTYVGGDAGTYIDGVLTERKTNATVPSTFVTDTKSFFHIGCRSAKSNVFNGKIDDLRIYSRVLSDTEIAALAARGR